jgi:hypothetical protein
MYPKSRGDSSSHQCALWFGVVAFTAYAGCVGDPPKRIEAGDGGSSGTSDVGGSGGSSAGGKGGKGGQGQGADAGMSGAPDSGGGGNESAGGADAVDGGAAGMAAGSGGEGGAECASGLVTCPGGAECTTDLDVGHASGDTVNDCGECGVTCSLDHAMSSTCSDGACEPECSPGFEDCNAATSNDGCETDLSSPAACGECGRACARTGVATAECTDDKCVPACATGFFDCNLDDGSGEDDGCELHGDALSTCGATCESSGLPCASNQVCNAGSCADPQGLVMFSIPFTTAGQVQRYGNRFSPYPDLTNSTLVMRVYVPGALGGSLFVYPTDATGSSQGPGVTVPLDTLSAGWVDIEIPIAETIGDFDPATVFQLTIEVSSGSTGPWLNPTVVYVDSIWSENGLPKDTFDANLGQMIASTILTVAGSSLSWVATPTP